MWYCLVPEAPNRCKITDSSHPSWKQPVDPSAFSSLTQAGEQWLQSFNESSAVTLMGRKGCLRDNSAFLRLCHTSLYTPPAAGFSSHILLGSELGCSISCLSTPGAGSAFLFCWKLMRTSSVMWDKLNLDSAPVAQWSQSKDGFNHRMVGIEWQKSVPLLSLP